MGTGGREHRRHVPHRPLMMRQREAESGPALALGMVALLTIGIATLVFSGRLIDVSIPRFIAHVADPALPSRPTDGAVPLEKLAAAEAASARANTAVSVFASTPIEVDEDDPDEAPAPAMKTMTSAEAAPAAQSVPPVSTEQAAQVLAVGAKARVANTDGQGVVLYGAPRPSARQPAGLLEGTAVTVLAVSGTEWAQVQSGSRQTGWVHSEFLAPAE